MPVELPPLESKKPAPQPPRAIVWLTVFLVCILVGVVSTLLTWPATEPTGSPWFWIRLLVIPILAWCLAFGLRLHYYDEQTAILQAENEVRQQDRATALQFGSEPLAVIACTYLCAFGETDAASEIVRGKTAIVSKVPQSGGEAVRHTALTLSRNEGESGRYNACFKKLLGLLSGGLAAVPRNLPLSVCLQVPSEVDQAQLLEIWQACWRENHLRPAHASLLSAEQGLLALDEWLDIRGGLALEKFTLFVSVQLHETPPEKTAESAVALLLGWAPLAERHGAKPLAMLHRPVDADIAFLNDSVTTALLLGRTTALEADDLWQSGLKDEDKPALIQSASDLSLGVSKTDALCGIHDVDVALGHPGIAAGWLAVALAVEHARQINKPQLVVWREQSLRIAVAQPTALEAVAPAVEAQMEVTA
jgi:hypothetical protein